MHSFIKKAVYIETRFYHMVQIKKSLMLYSSREYYLNHCKIAIFYDFLVVVKKYSK